MCIENTSISIKKQLNHQICKKHIYKIFFLVEAKLEAMSTLRQGKANGARPGFRICPSIIFFLKQVVGKIRVT